MVRVIIERRGKPGKERELHGLLVEMRGKVLEQHAHLSSETYRSVEDPLLWVVISSWLDVNYWKTWESSPERQKIASTIEPLLVGPEKIYIFELVF